MHMRMHMHVHVRRTWTGRCTRRRPPSNPYQPPIQQPPTANCHRPHTTATANCQPPTTVRWTWTRRRTRRRPPSNPHQPPIQQPPTATPPAAHYSNRQPPTANRRAQDVDEAVHAASAARGERSVSPADALSALVPVRARRGLPAPAGGPARAGGGEGADGGAAAATHHSGAAHSGSLPLSPRASCTPSTQVGVYLVPKTPKT
jgi:hypothetical protein